VVVALMGLMFAVPLLACAPLQPAEAVQELTFAEFQASIEEPPAAIEVGEALSVTVGDVTTVTLAEADAVPPAPVQLSV
jgi:hypothetical protein